MRCNACWRELEGQAITTTCGHLLCTADASKILGSDGACPICDQVLSKSHMKPVDINPSDEWVNMSMAGVSPQILMKSSYKSIMFYVGQMELEMQCKMNRLMTQCRQKCEALQEKCNEKMEQMHTAYQKMGKRCQMMQQEMENLAKDKQELQDKFAEKSRQKRKLDEMYDQLRSEFESVKRSAIQPANNFYSRPEPDLFSNPTNLMDNQDTIRKDRLYFTPETPGPRGDIWPARQTSNNSGGGTFEVSGNSPVRRAPLPVDPGNRRPMPTFGSGGSNASMTLRNLVLSPIKRPQMSRNNRSHLFTL